RVLEKIGRYRILSELGRGAMGVVYKAQDPTIGRLVAIKTIRLGDLVQPEEREQLRSRLFREAQSAGSLSHPGIVTIYDIAEEDNLAYITMEFVDGQTLEKIIEQGAVQDPKSLITVATQTAMALDYAHSTGIVHRDIKPGNIMANTEGVVKITDFGIARIASSKFTHTGTVMGTPSYMSPEQVRGAVVDGRSDMFSLAVLVYEMLTGQKPFSGESITTVIFKIVSEHPVPPKELNPSVGNKINAVVMKALSKEPLERYQKCREFAEALQAAAEQTANLTPAVRRMPSAFDATEASDPALLTQPDRTPEPRAPTTPEIVLPVPVAKETVEVSAGAAPSAEGAVTPPPPPKAAATPSPPVGVVPPTISSKPSVEAATLAGREKVLPPLEGKKVEVAAAPVVEKKLPPLEGQKVEAAAAPIAEKLPPLEKPVLKAEAPAAEKPPAEAKKPAEKAAPPVKEKKPELKKAAVAAKPAEAKAAAAPRRGQSWTPIAVAIALALGAAGAYYFSQRGTTPVQPSVPSKVVEAPAPAPTEPPEAKPSAAVSSKAPETQAAKPAVPVPPPAPNTPPRVSPPAEGEGAAAGAAGGRVVNIDTDTPGVQAMADNNADLSCTTPCSIPVASGKHVISFSKAGFHPERREVQMGKAPVDLHVTLRPVFGTVMLSTDPPGATVRVDGKPAPGQTPMQLRLPPGSHVLTLTKEGVGTGQHTVEVTDDSMLPVHIKLQTQ
ncbi:MAG: protein kinase, partial [Acidobacteria bacterium]|nr:protein kinase [Acidobacteriota bacterium]